MGTNCVQERPSTNAQRSSMTEALRGRRIVVPETRELGQLVRMLEEHGAEAIPCPMIAIRDAPRTTRKITRGPKPVRALREIGLDADMPADEPTTEGVIAAMRRHDFGGHHVGVQLYPRNPNRRLMDFIDAAGAVPDPVLPYVYVSEADDSRVLAIINGMARGQFDAIAFTSAPQVRRLREVAHATGRESDLLQGFKRIVVA